MRLLIVVLLLIAGCNADTRPSAPFAVPATREPTEEPTEQPIERVETGPAESGGITTTGAILSSFESEQVNVPIHVVYYNSAGEVVGGSVTHVEHVPAGGQIAFEADTSVTVSEIAETRVFGHIGFGD